MPATLLVVGEVLSSIATALEIWLESESHISETSSSVGPSPLVLAGDSENGNRLSRIVAGDVLIGPDAGIPIPLYREESTGLCPCLADITIKVEPRRPRLLRACTILPMDASANSISVSKEEVGVPCAS